MAQGRDVENPHKTLMIMVDTRPSRMTGFRPKKSDALPHIIAVQHWLRLKTALVIPEIRQFCVLWLGKG